MSFCRPSSAIPGAGNDRQRRRKRKVHDNIAIASLMAPVPAFPGEGLPPLGCSGGKSSKEVLFTIGIMTTMLQGGGLIFGASAFQSVLLSLDGSPFNSKNVGTVFSIGHNITCFGCIASGWILDNYGPRICAVSGLIIEAIGHYMMVHALDFPTWATCVGYGLIGLGGCQVLIAALTFCDAFQNSGLANALLTAGFQAGGFIFMILPYVPWDSFFWFYVVFCMVGATVTALMYPDEAPAPFEEEQEPSDMAAMSHAVANQTTLMSVLKRPGTIFFLLTFTVAGSSLLYGAGEFVVAIKAKDDCSWDDATQDFVNCKRSDLQDTFNNVGMPLVGNFILPCSLLLGRMIDKGGFALPAFVNIFFVQCFILSLWLLPLESQYVTLFIYNVANTAVFTVQNAYICANGHAHIGALFSISNLALGLGNLLSDYLNFNPFGSGQSAVTTSIGISSAIWIVACMPLYAWPIVEVVMARKKQRAVDSFVSSVITADGQVRDSCGNAYFIPTLPAIQSVGNFPRVDSGGDSPLSMPADSINKQAAVPFLNGSAINGSAINGSAINGSDVDVEAPSEANASAATALALATALDASPSIAWSPVVTVNPQLWEKKLRTLLEAGRENIFFVLDFDRTTTKCFLEDGGRSLDCHDILASIPKITPQCKQTMEALMEKYYPIEISATMTKDEKIPHMVEWYTLVNHLLGSQNLTRDDVAAAVRGCHDFRLRPGAEELFQLADRLKIPIVILSAGLGNVIEEVVRQRIRRADGTTGQPWPNVRVLSNTLQWGQDGHHTGFSEPLIHMYNKSLQDAPPELKNMIKGRHVGVLCGDGTGDLTMAHGHETTEVLKFGFLNEKMEERLPKYVGQDGYDRLILNDGTFESVLEVLRRIR